VRVTNPERWQNTKLAAFFLGLLTMIVGIGGLEGEPEPAIPSPTLFAIGLLIVFVVGSRLGPPKR